jgi:hypothetical protein
MNKKDGDQVVVGGPKDQGGNGLCGFGTKGCPFPWRSGRTVHGHGQNKQNRRIA